MMGPKRGRGAAKKSQRRTGRGQLERLLVFAVLPPSPPPQGLGCSYTAGRQTSCLLQIDHALVHLELLDLVLLPSCSGVKDAMMLWMLWICYIFM